jgi:hypothetical protein
MIDRLRGACRGILLALACACPLAGNAQGVLHEPRALTSPLPPAPVNARNVPTEGYVTVRYSVLADGKPTDVRAIDFMPPSIDPAPTVATVSSWTFAPGTRNGQPIEWHNGETVVVFRSTAGVEGDNAAFQERYAAIEMMLAADPVDYPAALAASESLLSEHSTQLSEIGVAMVQSAIIQIGAGTLNSALQRLRMATDPRVPMLSGTELKPALELRMRLEGELGRVGDALASHERLMKGLGPGNGDAEFTTIGQELRTKASTEEFLEVRGRIVSDSWRIDPMRRLFFIPRVEGTIRTIVAECDTRRIEIPFNSEDDYSLPDALGDCTIFVEGDRNTDFSFVEVLPAEE